MKHLNVEYRALSGKMKSLWETAMRDKEKPSTISFHAGSVAFQTTLCLDEARIGFLDNGTTYTKWCGVPLELDIGLASNIIELRANQMTRYTIEINPVEIPFDADTLV